MVGAVLLYGVQSDAQYDHDENDGQADVIARDGGKQARADQQQRERLAQPRQDQPQQRKAFLRRDRIGPVFAEALARFLAGESGRARLQALQGRISRLSPERNVRRLTGARTGRFVHERDAYSLMGAAAPEFYRRTESYSDLPMSYDWRTALGAGQTNTLRYHGVASGDCLIAKLPAFVFARNAAKAFP